MQKKNIGIITPYTGNYGSILQAFASCKYIKNLGYEPHIIQESGNKLKSRIKLLLRVLWYGKYIKEFLLIRKSSKESISSIGNSQNKMMKFVRENIPVLYVNGRELKKMGKSSDFVAFLSGSDQVWNGHLFSLNKNAFLRFCPEEKRIAWAPSIGTSDIAKYNRKVYKKYISQYTALSAREEQGKEIIEKLTGRAVERLMDPVFLLDRTEWEKIVTDTGNNYLACYFLDTPNADTVRSIKSFAEKENAKVVVFGYEYPIMKELGEYEYVGGGPEKFISYIANAKCLFTDSFHGISFATIMHTPFFAFRRNYTHGVDQSSRLISILELIGMREFFDTYDFDNRTWDFSVADSKIQKEREKMTDYFKNSLPKDRTNEEPILKGENDCIGCGACIAVCPKNAIGKRHVNFKNWIPMIDDTLCIRCRKCEKVCPIGVGNVRNGFDKKAYITYNLNNERRFSSASGGLFSAIATRFLENGGVVFGAKMYFDGGKAIVEHVRVKTLDDLPTILGSKYVQSDCIRAYGEVKEELRAGNKVLFSGCSCQIDGLKSYLGDIDISNLFTIDLICHGVPSIDFFNDYIKYLERKYDGVITDFSFRRKDGDKIIYEINATAIGKKGEKKISIPIRNSVYYRLFMEEETYRGGCYSCPYASLNKPADITTGDYFEAKDDYPELFVGENRIDLAGGISCIITHTEKGQSLIDSADKYLFLKEVDAKVVQASHSNLHKPSKYSRLRGILLKLYRIFGYGFLESIYFVRNKFADVVKKILKR